MIQLAPSVVETGLAQRCRSIGLPLLKLDADGSILTAHAARDTVLERAVMAAPMLAAALKRHARIWAAHPNPDPIEVWPGCWLLPLPILQRRRCLGYHVAVAVTREFLRAEQFHAICDAAHLDSRAATTQFTSAPLGQAADVPLWINLLRWMLDDIRRIEKQRDEIGALSRQLAETYEELSLVYKLSAHLSVNQDPRCFLQDSCDELHEVLGLNWIALQLTDADVRLDSLRGELLVSGLVPPACAALGDLTRSILHSCDYHSPRIIEDIADLHHPGAERLAQQLLIVPIIREGRPIAVLLGADKADDSLLSSADAKLANSAAQNMGIFLENAMLYEDMQDMFMGTLHSLIASIDAKDTYTCGHSERVAWLSRQLAEAAGLDPHTVERVYLSALVHDVGKIGVPEAVLCKPGRLTDEEFDMIKAHPEIGARILKDIRQMHDLIPGVLHHHERYDGKGYPHRLAANDIPLFGRLIALADSFDAMSSNRTYRRALALPDVLAEIERCAASQFDPALAAVFVKLDFAPFYQMLEEHQQRVSPLNEALRSAP